MNIGELKAFLGDRSQQADSVSSKSARTEARQQLQEQLREIGLQQAARGVSASFNSEEKFSSRTTVGLRVYSDSLNRSIEINEKKPGLTAKESGKGSLFDFEEVAKNVLRFVGGAIKSAAAKGADEDALLGMFEQAKSGVLRGIKMAEDDLAGFMNEEIEEGIANSKTLIDEGIKRLEDRIFGREEPDQQTTISQSTSVSASQERSGEFYIRTRDGDEVQIRFEDLQQFEASRSSIIELGKITPVDPTPETPDVVRPAPETDEPAATPTQAVAPNSDNEEPSVSAPAEQEGQEQSGQSVTQTTETRFEFVDRSSYSFSVSGELDEAELKAIGNLVSDATDLADEFFNGDVEQAFNQALEIGYDRQELAGFALQLTRQEQVEVVQTYEAVSHFNEGVKGGDDPVRAVKPVSQYLEKMLSVLEQSKQKLEDGNAYENMINGIVNKVGGLGTDELIGAINQFHSFNKQLLDSLPSNAQ